MFNDPILPLDLSIPLLDEEFDELEGDSAEEAASSSYLVYHENLKTSFE